MEKSLDEIINDKSSQRKSQSSRSRQRTSTSSYRPYSRDSQRHPLRRDRSHSPPKNRYHQPGVTIKVTNLHYELLESDLEELLSRVGKLKNIKIVYDRSGRSEGVAYATFNTRKEAQSAVDKFDGQMAAGSPITVIIEHDNSLAQILGTSSSRDNSKRNPRDLENGKWVRGQQAPATRRKPRAHHYPANKQDLDAELDDYWKQKDTVTKDDSVQKTTKSIPLANPPEGLDSTKRVSRDTEMVLE